jgi:hypothetical protein
MDSEREYIVKRALFICWHRFQNTGCINVKSWQYTILNFTVWALVTRRTVRKIMINVAAKKAVFLTKAGCFIGRL